MYTAPFRIQLRRELQRVLVRHIAPAAAAAMAAVAAKRRNLLHDRCTRLHHVFQTCRVHANDEKWSTFFVPNRQVKTVGI